MGQQVLEYSIRFLAELLIIYQRTLRSLKFSLSGWRWLEFAKRHWCGSWNYPSNYINDFSLFRTLVLYFRLAGMMSSFEQPKKRIESYERRSRKAPRSTYYASSIRNPEHKRAARGVPYSIICWIFSTKCSPWWRVWAWCMYPQASLRTRYSNWDRHKWECVFLPFTLGWSMQILCWPVPIDFYNDVFYIESSGLSTVANLDQAVHCPREEPTLRKNMEYAGNQTAPTILEFIRRIVILY